MRFQLFTDPIYHSDRYVELQPSDVMAVERKTVSLFLRGKHQVTYVTLKSGAEHALVGDVVAQIEAAQHQNQSTR